MSNIKLFEQKKIRSQWNAEEEKWYFSLVDIVAVLSDSPNLNNYWKVVKKHCLAKEGKLLAIMHCCIVQAAAS